MSELPKNPTASEMGRSQKTTMRTTFHMQTVKSVGQQIADRVKAIYPDVYWIPQVGWCGTQWQDAERLARWLNGENGCSDTGISGFPKDAR